MAEKIQARYDDLADIASRFSKEAAEIEQMQQRLRNVMGNLEGGGWVGQAANAFFAEMNDEVLPAVQRLTDALEEAGKATKQISDILSNAEQEARATITRVTW